MGALNREQRDAVSAHRGISFVLAGAGTGKTRTLVDKVGNLISDGGISPEEIVIFTFSRKAAREIVERLADEIGPKTSGIIAGTFHHVALKLLKEYGRDQVLSRGYARFPSIMDDEVRDEIVRDIVEPMLFRFKGLPFFILSGMITGKNLPGKRYAARLDAQGISGSLAEVRVVFNRVKMERCLMDFDDIINFTVSFLRSDTALRRRVNERFRYLLVDEFQDTSADTFSLIRLLMPDEGGNLFAVGDDWQSIYGFRDARIDYLVNVKKYFPQARIHRLRMNYRSRREIIDAAGRFIRRNRFRTRKRLIAGKGRGGIVSLMMAQDFMEESAMILSILEKEAAQNRDVSAAVLYRNNWQGVRIQKALAEGGIAEKIPGLQCMTMHASKGLEFDSVVIAGIADSIIPDRTTDIEEERRLLYVAMTRARERLSIIGHFNARGEKGIFMKELGLGS